MFPDFGVWFRDPTILVCIEQKVFESLGVKAEVFKSLFLHALKFPNYKG